MKEIIPIFYACDDTFVKYMIVSLNSMIENADREKKYHVHILHTSVCEEMQQKTLEMANENFDISFDDVTDYLKSINDKLPLRDYYSKTTYYRFFIAEMFPQYKKAIYIDSDTVVLGDISGLFRYDLEGYYVAAAPDQAVRQVEEFGIYAEQVVGIDRQQFFNAGMMVINCDEFRKNHVLDQFISLLHIYNFVVAQDEDYLNVICKDRVLLLPQKWNALVVGELVCEESEIQIIHYIMVSKPWHFEDCRMKEYFWDYAKKTEVYEDILKEFHSYTDQQRKADLDSADRLLQLAIDEINREDNFHKMQKKNGKGIEEHRSYREKLRNSLKKYRKKSKTVEQEPIEPSRDRLDILKKIEQYEEEGRFDEDVEEDPPTKELLPEDIDYLREKFSSRLKARFTYRVARSFLNNIIENKQLIVKEIRGIEHFKNLDSGAIITCNHFNALDSFAIQIAYEASGQKDRTFYRVIREGNYTNFPGFYGLLMRNCNTFPLSSNAQTMKKFIQSMDRVLQKGDFMLFYPEQSMWWNYRKPKPLKKGAYNFAAKNHVPVLPCFITMEDSDILGTDGFYVQEYTIHVSAPIYPDVNKTKAQNMEEMRQKNYEVWKQIYEETYNEPLVYSCDKDRIS